MVFVNGCWASGREAGGQEPSNGGDTRTHLWDRIADGSNMMKDAKILRD